MTTQEKPDRAGVIAFPPALFAGTFVVGLLLHVRFPTPWLPTPVALTVGVLLIIAGVATLLVSFRSMINNDTTIHPKGATTTIVSDGLYRYTRNPMYLSLTVIYLGAVVMTNAWWSLLLLIPLLVVVQKGIIEREERYLTGKFGDEYLRYKANVRRWL